MKINPTLYSQRDPQWAYKPLGFLPDTIGNQGCLLTSTAMAASVYGKKITPDQLNEEYKQHNGFYSGNLYSWGGLTRVFPDITERVVDTSKHALSDFEIGEIRAALDAGYPVILGVDYKPATVNLETHFVLAVDYGAGDTFTIADPWTGTIVPLSSYGNTRKTIFQYMIYKGVQEKPAFTFLRQNITFAKTSSTFVEFTIDCALSETREVGLAIRKDPNVVAIGLSPSPDGVSGGSLLKGPKWIDQYKLTTKLVQPGMPTTFIAEFRASQAAKDGQVIREDIGLYYKDGSWVPGINLWIQGIVRDI